MSALLSAETVPHRPSLNALKHGLRSAATLLPGDNRAAFRALRDGLFHLYQPRTGDEAFCVSQMAKLQWRIRRVDRWQDVYDDQQEALLFGDPGLDSPLCEADAHRSLHRPMDCELHAGRMDRRLRRLGARLLELQRLRRLGLIAGAQKDLPDYREFLAAEQADEGEPAEAVSHSGDGENGENSERGAAAPARLLPGPHPALGTTGAIATGAIATGATGATAQMAQGQRRPGVGG